MVPADLELTIERLSSDGTGIARAPDGRITFVPFTAPGDRVRAKVSSAKRSFLRADLQEVLEPGPERVTPACAVFGRCGGCAWQHINYATQVRAKEAILTDALARIGHVTLDSALSVLASPEPYAYRGRARVLVAAGRPGYRRAASEQHQPVTHCPILMPPLNAALAALADTQPADGEWELALGEIDALHPDGVRVTHLGAAQPAGAPLSLAAGSERVRIAPGGFAQANPLLFQALIDAVAEACGGGARLLELYAGSGFFTLSLARRFAAVLAVESDATAVAHLRDAAQDAGIGGIEALAEDVDSFVSSARLAQFAPQVVFVDPPRTGLSSAVVDVLSRPGHNATPRRLVYLSCDPATLARDVAGLCAARWKLVSAQGFDLFPQTPHVEGLVVLQR